MSSLMMIEEEIESLPEDDFIILREWFQDLDSKKWDKQIENDANAGKLNELASAALIDFKNGKYKAV